MSKQTKFILIIISVILIIGFLAFFTSKKEVGQNSELDDFAKCLTNSGAKFYGTFWCSHCQNQKRAFGTSIEYINYVECSTSDAKNQTDACKEAGIESYPTWIFADGERLSGEVSFDVLSNKTSCQLSALDNN